MRGHVNIRRIVIESVIRWETYATRPSEHGIEQTSVMHKETLSPGHRHIKVYCGRRIVPYHVNLVYGELSHYIHPDPGHVWLNREYRAPVWLMAELRRMVDAGELA